MNRLLKTGLTFIFCFVVGNHTKAEDIFNYVAVLSPSEYGAIPNDNIDDSDAFQCCLDEARKKVGTKIIIPPGRYIIAKQLNINKTTFLFIEGNGAVLVKPSGNGSNIFYGNYNKQITIQNIIFEGNRVPDFKEKWPERMNACVIIGRSNGIRFENCVVKSFHYGVCLGTSTENGYDVWVENCTFDNNNSDIDLYGKPIVHISGNVSHNCTGHSIQIEPPYKRDGEYFDYTKQPQKDALSVGNIIFGNVIEGCHGIGIVVFGGSEDINISNNQVINFGTAGILVHKGASNINICNNIISNSTYEKKNDRPWTEWGAGIVVNDAMNTTIVANIISHANTGVYVTETKGATISHNKISNSKESGICLYKSTQCLFDGNHIDNFNLNKFWWANSGMVLYGVSDIVIGSMMVTDTNNNPYSIYSNYCERIQLYNIVGVGYSRSLTYPSLLYKE